MGTTLSARIRLYVFILVNQVISLIYHLHAVPDKIYETSTTRVSPSTLDDLIRFRSFLIHKQSY